MKENVRVKANAIKGLNDICMQGEIVVFGSTYMSKVPLYELVNKNQFESAIYNRSIDGLTIEEALEIVQECVLDIKPDKIFLALGEEDERDANAVTNYTRLVRCIRAKLPACELYLICLQGVSEYAERFNANIRSLCEQKKVKCIRFTGAGANETALYKTRFKQLSCFFRSKPLTMPDAFAMAEL